MPRSKDKLPVPVNPLSAIAAHPPRVSVFDSMKEGFSFGVGSGMAHSMVDSFFRKPQAQQVPVKAPCADEHILFEKCLINWHGDDSYCIDSNRAYTQCIKEKRGF